MEEIEVVIKIPQEEYETIVNSEDCGLHTLTRAIAHGTILPKGHGRLIDADGACEGNCAECPVNDICIVNKAPTVIEVYEGAE